LQVRGTAVNNKLAVTSDKQKLLLFAYRLGADHQRSWQAMYSNIQWHSCDVKRVDGEVSFIDWETPCPDNDEQIADAGIAAMKTLE